MTGLFEVLVGIVCLVVLVIGITVDEMVDGVNVGLLKCGVGGVTVVVVVDEAALLVDMGWVILVVLVGSITELVPS